MIFIHNTKMGVIQDVTILNRYGVKHNVEEQYGGSTNVG
jgi:hypothetical protein